MIDLSTGDPEPEVHRLRPRGADGATRAPAPRPPAPAPTHLDLLAMASALRGAAIDGDTQRMHVELSRLRTALVHHLHTEHRGAPEPAGSGSAVTTLVADSQQRLLDLVDGVILLEGGDPERCQCLVRAVEVEVALRRLARLEARLLGGRPPPG